MTDQFARDGFTPPPGRRRIASPPSTRRDAHPALEESSFQTLLGIRPDFQHRPRERANAELGDCEGERVCRVTRRSRRKSEHGPHHERHLALVGLPVTDDRTLDPGRRILRKGHLRALETQQDDAPSVSELRCGLRVLVEEQRFYRGDLRPMSRDDLGKGVGDVHEPARQGLCGARMNDTMRDVAQASAVSQDDAPTEM